jgi:hypothetical protein
MTPEVAALLQKPTTVERPLRCSAAQAFAIYGIDRPVSVTQVQEVFAWSDEFLTAVEQFLA